jgi:hypothetical protein
VETDKSFDFNFSYHNITQEAKPNKIIIDVYDIKLISFSPKTIFKTSWSGKNSAGLSAPFSNTTYRFIFTFSNRAGERVTATNYITSTKASVLLKRYSSDYEYIIVKAHANWTTYPDKKRMAWVPVALHPGLQFEKAIRDGSCPWRRPACQNPRPVLEWHYG